MHSFQLALSCMGRTHVHLYTARRWGRLASSFSRNVSRVQNWSLHVIPILYSIGKYLNLHVTAPRDWQVLAKERLQSFKLQG